MDIAKIVAKASSIFERLNGNFLTDVINQNENLIDERIEQWCKKIAKGNWELFNRRFDWDKIELNQVKQLLGSVTVKNPQELPEWANLLQEVFDYMQNTDTDMIVEEYQHFQTKYPFVEILCPFVLIAKTKLIAQVGSVYELLTPEAISCLELNLLQDLSLIASNVLYLEFSIFRSRKLSSLERLLLEKSEQKSPKIYAEFISDLFEGKLWIFLEEYAVLARLLSTITKLWIEANVEFILRLSSDIVSIQSRIFNNQNLGRVIELKPALSDYHNGRRAVIILQFESGDKLVYKPKNLSIDRTYFEFLEWLNQQGIPLAFKSLKLLNQKGYGWVEYAENLPSKDANAAHQFYQRAGMLLCLMYLLEGVDCYYENIIANGEYPLLIDMETLLHNNFKLEREYSESYQIRPIDLIWWNSVFRVGLLPTWRPSADWKIAYNIGGLREAGKLVLPFFKTVWCHPNTDAMKRDSQQIVIDVKSSVPRLNDEYLQATDYVDEVVTGFQQMYLFLANKKDELLAPQSPFHNLARQKVRYILRNTKFYNSILQTLLEPEYLRDGVDRSIEIDVVSRISLDTGKKAIHWPLVKFETAALEQMDIPFFSMDTNSTSIDLPNGEILESFCENTSIDNVINRLHSFNEQDLKTQIRLTESILRLSSISGKHSTSLEKEKDDNFDAVAVLSPQEMIAEATMIAQQLQELAFYCHDGSITWIAPQLQAEKYILQPLRLDIYGGAAGIIVFLAALEKVTGGAGYAELIQGAIIPLREAITTIPVQTLSKNGYTIGGVAGIASLIYAFTRISEFLEMPSLLEDAQEAASLISPKWINEDKHLDVVSGSAGAILALLALYQKTNAAEILAKAICCGEHLLHTRTSNNKGFRAWHQIGADFVTGFSHGAAGIAYALLRLYKATDDNRFFKMARESVAYEQSVFDKLAGNWPDYREAMQINSDSRFMTAWCHGAPGIALARMGGLSVLNTAEIEKDVLAALETIRNFSLRGKDHLCCGNFGRIEVLQIAAQTFSRQELADLAIKQASWIVHRAKERGSYQLFDTFIQGIFHPSFFQGTSGIGYQLLRLTQPDLLPSVLLLE
ncbi:MAG: type 2 lantipeptide synthetase LanM [Dolichospermum sp. DET50]|nr:type 2 lantipeptide synthetase LanM [Dolichospermum sp. DET66]MBS3033338.1 type 2 lantipeptide synthetase LanM [Dolichospermum sp. DET67]MBS3038542.1 type 2 lantipeptide synthetase LanM [Dolichospermum sp. DET50]QSX70418.1 MAG: type 2 lantipeptide synthetase LanM family protein [Dolichospermum sp. DET69]